MSYCIFGIIYPFPIGKTWCLTVLRWSVLKSTVLIIANPFLYALGIGLQTRTWTYLTSGRYLCGISPHFVKSGDISFFIYLFVYESQVFVTWSLVGRERTLGISVCVWWPLLHSGVVSWRVTSTCFRTAISLQGKEKSSSLLTFLY